MYEDDIDDAVDESPEGKHVGSFRHDRKTSSSEKEPQNCIMIYLFRPFRENVLFAE